MLVLCAIAPPAVLAQNKTSEPAKPVFSEVTVGFHKYFPPYSQLDENGLPVGFAIDVMDAVGKKIGLRIKYKVFENGNLMVSALKSGSIDIIPSYGISDKRKQIIAFTHPLDTFRIVLFVRENTQGVTSINDLKRRPVAAVIDNVGYRFLKKKHPEIQAKVYPKLVDAMFALLSAKVDAFVYPEPVAWKLAREARVSSQIKVAAKPLLEIKRGMGVRLDNTKLLAVLDQAVIDFVLSPKYQEIYVTWFGKPDPFWTVVRVFWGMGAGLAVIIMSMAWWRYRSILLMSKRLAKSEERYEFAVTGTNDGLWDWNIHTDEDYFSPRWKQILGYEAYELDNVLESFINAMHPEDNDRAAEALKAHLENHTPYDLEYRLRCKDGSYVWVHAKGQAIWGDDGKPLRMAGTISDITERRQAEETLQKRTHDLGERIKEQIGLYSFSEALNRPNTTIEKILEEAVEVLPPAWHYPKITCARITTNVFEVTTKNFKETVWRQASDILVSGKRTGEIEVFYLEKTPELDEGPFLKEERLLINQMAGRLGEHIEYKRLEAQLQQAQRMEAVGQLTGGVAHDFNNLMAVMIGNAEILEGKIYGDEEAEKSVAAIIRAVERGANLTEHLLAFSRQLRLSPAKVDLNHLVLGIEDMLSRALGETIDLKFVPDESIWPVMIDPAQLEHALVNLCLNARDAMPKGGALVIETLNTNLDETYAEQHDKVTPGDYIKISVSDTGEGMTSKVIKKAFEPFFTTKGVGEGSGLGLSMVFGFTQQSGGHATIYSEVGKGTTVKVYLPRLVGAKKEVADVKEEPKELPRGTERILIVEDEEAVLKISMAALSEYGYDVSEAKDGNEALQYFKDGQTFDLLFTDVVLPGGMNGVEIAEEVKKLQPGIRVLYTTGYMENVVVHNGVLDEAATLVKKPYRRAELLEKVRAAFDGEDA